jgi:peptidoglycan hydrolase-like protein with peptidoglycan-binding domain
MKQQLLCFVVTLCAISLVRADQTIRSLQQTLKDQGFYYGTVTGEKSAETTAAIRRYQIRNGLKVTGEIDEETTRSLNSSSNSVAAAPRPSSKPAAPQLNTVRPDTGSSLSQTSPLPAFRQPDRGLETNPSYSASFYQSAPTRVNGRMIAGVQQQLMARGYYRGRVDGTYGPQTAFALRAFQSGTGLPPTGWLDMQTLDALGLSNPDLAYQAPVSHQYETWIPVTKFKHGKWKVKWKKYHQSDRDWVDQAGDEDQQANSVYGAQGYNDD